MRDFIQHYKNPNEDSINFGLMNREYDKPLIEYIVNSCKSLEVLDSIKFLGYEYVDDQSQIDINNYLMSRRRKSKKDETKYMYLNDSRYAEVILKFKLTLGGDVDYVKKRLLIPVVDESGYYTSKGKKYFLLYQLVDSSTYINIQRVTLKSLMPIVIKRNVVTKKDTQDNEYSIPTYVVNVFSKVDVLLFYFAKLGVKRTLEFFSVNTVIEYSSVPDEDLEKYIYFKISNKLFLKVNRYFFEKHQYVQSIVFMILNISTNRVNREKLESKVYWIERIGALSGSTNVYNHYDKGCNTLTFFERMLDETTKELLKLQPENKKSIYSVVRWIVQNYNELRKKDNLDLTNKRLRCNEYIASLITKQFSDRLNRAVGSNKIEKLKDIFKFPGDIILKQFHNSGLFRYDDKINDLDFFSKLKFTLKNWGHYIVIYNENFFNCWNPVKW